ncbi:SGNH/GDSL hydrolase family protein [Streptacidiphilus cavernicola]|uniref:SGNH/GDSL hydrolase family protein n=1 Tax=Streptacidiphilus cavernicola TaxID=3342716 RepID=A0ABV6VZI6_9ACTN
MARRTAAALAYGGAGVGLLGVGLVGLLLAEAKLAEIQLDALKGEPPRADGLYGQDFAGQDLAGRDAPPLAMAVLGDSTAAGFGVDRGRDTPGALLAGGIASIAERPVRLLVVAANGAASDDLERQTRIVLDGRPAPDVALIMVGANDIAQRITTAQSVRMLGDTVRQLRAAGTQVVVGTCPDLGVVQPIRPPLRTLARLASHRLAAAQSRVVTANGGHSVELGSLLGPEFAHKPQMFASDRYHPSVQGYLTAVMALLPAICTALAIWPNETPPVERQAVPPVLLPDRAGVGAGTRVGRMAAPRRRARLQPHRG